MGEPAEDDAWREVRRTERVRVRNRRIWLAGTGWDCPGGDGEVGLALSGGGIRSATFSLGLMVSLSQAKLLHAVDYLSTVSGGGYAGAFFCSLFVPQEMRGSVPQPVTPEAARKHAERLGEDVFGSPHGRDALTQLRQGGHYLAPNGTSDALFAGMIAVRNWLALALVTGLSLLAIFLTVYFLLWAMAGELGRAAVWLGFEQPGQNDVLGLWIVLMAILSVWPLSCAWAFWFTRNDPVPAVRWRPFSIQLVVALIIAATVYLNPFNVFPEEWPPLWRRGIPIIAVGAIAVYVLAEVYSYRAARGRKFDIWPLVAIAIGATLLLRIVTVPPQIASLIWQLVLAFVLVGLAGAYLAYEIQVRRLGSNGSDAGRAYAVAEEDRVRTVLSSWAFTGTYVLVAVAVLGAISRLGQYAYADLRVDLGSSVTAYSVSLTSIVATLLPLARWLLKRQFAGSSTGQVRRALLRRAGRVSALLVGLSLLLLLVTFWAALAYSAMTPTDAAGVLAVVAELWQSPGPFSLAMPDWDLLRRTVVRVGPDLAPLIFAVIVAGCAALLGHIDALLNQSSLASFYGARIRRAYLGASNADRWTPAAAVDTESLCDEIQLDSYYHPAVMAPIHLINVTINETTSRSSRVIQRDRKGKPMAVGPDGYLYPRNSAGGEMSLIARGDAEALPLSSWIGISGAAFSTGAGFHTSLGTALLAGLANLRLGYWWYSRKRTLLGPWFKPGRWIQAYLLREIRASYEGTCSHRWYLSDGGHYENTGVYELVRRRVGFIIASDNGADPAYEFGDLVNLIRKLRIDFEAEVEFLGEDELDDLFGDSALGQVFGTLDRIRNRGEQAVQAAADAKIPPPKAGPYATLARIRYQSKKDETAGTPPSTLILIKPRITGKELPDLLQYRDANTAFPQQPTTDQFFDEAQWESYYRLGQLIGDMVFDATRFDEPVPPGAWRPWQLRSLP